MNRHEKRLHHLAALAEDVPPVNSARIAAAIVIGNSIISYGFNSYKTHPMQSRFNKKKTSITTPRQSKINKLGFTPGMDAVCIHAEIHSIVNALKRIDQKELRRSTLYISRTKKIANSDEKTWGLVKPCPSCMSAITAFGIKKVFFTCEGVGNYDEVTL